MTHQVLPPEPERRGVASLEQVSPILNDEALAMEQLALRLERLRPAVQRRDVAEIAHTAANIREFAGPVDAFHLTSGDEALARFEQARLHLLAVLQDSPEEASGQHPIDDENVVRGEIQS